VKSLLFVSSVGSLEPLYKETVWREWGEGDEKRNICLDLSYNTAANFILTLPYSKISNNLAADDTRAIKWVLAIS
jgi:hypothetical protein